MFKALLMAVALTLSLALASGAEAALEATVNEAPVSTTQSVVLSFSDQVDAGRSTVRVFTPSGHEIAIEDLRTGGHGTDLVAPIKIQLSPGVYRVLWRAVSRNGRTSSGTSELTVPSDSARRGSAASDH